MRRTVRTKGRTSCRLTGGSSRKDLNKSRSKKKTPKSRYAKIHGKKSKKKRKHKKNKMKGGSAGGSAGGSGFGTFRGGVPASNRKPPSGPNSAKKKKPARKPAKKKFNEDCNPELDECEAGLKCNHGNKCQEWNPVWNNDFKKLRETNTDIEVYNLIQIMFKENGDKDKVEEVLSSYRAQFSNAEEVD